MITAIDNNIGVLLTEDLPGCGGSIEGVEDFEVEEIPAYLPSGSGEHCMLFLEKRDLTTPQAIRLLCQELRIDQRYVGYAGMKDKNSISRQWITIHRVDPLVVKRIKHENLRVLHADYHRNKIKTGHLRGNRFTIVLRGVVEGGDERAKKILHRLVAEGLPNYYGEQRFGRQGDNAQEGLKILRKERPMPRDRMKRRLLISSLQSLIFNRVLSERIVDRLLHQLVGGEVLQRTDSSGLFVSDDTTTDQERLSRQVVVITGPICGPRMPLPRAAALAREQSVFDHYQTMPSDFGRLGRLARGARRALVVPIQNPTVESLQEGNKLRLKFALPAGSYATVLLRELTKGFENSI